jgi:steroid delta-isomerase-like uncharacterized protein
MSIEENKAIARRFIQIWGNGDLNVIDELSAPSLTVQYPVLPNSIQGKEMFKRVMESFRSAFPDSALQIEDEIAENDRVVIRWTFSGTHEGIMLGIPASHKKVKWTGITIYKIVEGKIIQEIGEEDYLGFLRQIGIVHKP